MLEVVLLILIFLFLFVSVNIRYKGIFWNLFYKLSNNARKYYKYSQNKQCEFPKEIITKYNLYPCPPKNEIACNNQCSSQCDKSTGNVINISCGSNCSKEIPIICDKKSICDNGREVIFGCWKIVIEKIPGSISVYRLKHNKEVDITTRKSVQHNLGYLRNIIIENGLVIVEDEYSNQFSASFNQGTGELSSFTNYN